MYLHEILCEAWISLCENYWGDTEGRSYRQLVLGSFIMTTRSLMHHISRRFFVKHEITQMIQPPTAQIWCPVTSDLAQN